jgi:beta-N-acetylhexosaminidase
MAGASGVHGIPAAAVHALAAGCDLLCIGTGNTAAQLEEIVAAIESAVVSGRLPAERVTDAAGRVRALASSVPPAVPGTGAVTEAAPTAVPAGLPADLPARIASSFHVGPAVRERLAGAGGVGTIVRVDTAANIAVGEVPWGPFALVAAPDPVRPAPAWLTDAAVVPLDASAPLADPAGLAGPVLVVGKDLHRHPFAVDAIARLRAARRDVVTADLGWPSDDLALADLATFGASRVVAEAFASVVDDALRAAPVEAS